MSLSSPPRALLAATALLLAACSSGSNSPATGGAGTGATGQAGTTGNAGSSGGGGTTGNAGTSGGAGVTGVAGTTGNAGTTGAAGAGGTTGNQGPTGTAGTGGAGQSAAGTSGAAGTSAPDGGTDAKPTTDAAVAKFSFFETSLEAMRRLSKSQNGFGGDLRYGETDGLKGADKICTEVAETSMKGAGAKGWHAFLSAAAGPVNAIDRIGNGPWYDRLGRLVAMNKAALLNPRPVGADPVIINDLPNEHGIPNHRPDPSMPEVDNHHVLTGSDAQGKLYGATATCASWTSTAASAAGRPRIGFSWPHDSRINWISGQDEGGCGAGVNVVETGGSTTSNPIVGSGGGYGGIYCFADVP
jgi:hypothetical protein